MPMFIDRESKLQPVLYQILTQIDFCSTLVYWLANTELHSLQLVLIAAVGFIVIRPGLSTYRTTLKTFESHFLIVKVVIEFKISLFITVALPQCAPNATPGLSQFLSQGLHLSPHFGLSQFPSSVVRPSLHLVYHSPPLLACTPPYTWFITAPSPGVRPSPHLVYHSRQLHTYSSL